MVVRSYFGHPLRLSRRGIPVQLSTVAIGVITGIFLILYGGSIIFLWIGDHRARRFLDQMFPDIPEVDAKDVTDEKKNQH